MKKIFLITLFSIWTLVSFSQQTVSGMVKDNGTQKVLQEVVVSVVGTSITSNTNELGSFTLKNVPTGKQIIKLSKNGFESQSYPLVIANEAINIGTVELYEAIDIDDDQSLINLSDNDLDDDEGSADNTSGLLQSSRDVFSRAAAFNFPWFRVRGYDSENANVLINGIKMNKVNNGRPQWSDWGGLNDVLRNQEFANGLAPAEKTFGGVLGSTSIDTRASQQRAGTRISAASTNRNYNGRAMVTHNSGLNKKGWAYSLSASSRFAKEGYNEGSSYNSWSAFANIEKKINDKHSINLTAFYTPNRRGKSSPATQEVYDLKGLKYNSYWGKQAGKNRNSRMKEIKEPTFILSHDWNINDKTTLNTNIGYQTGTITNGRIGYFKAQNPDPSYYKNLPSYQVAVGNLDQAYQLEQAFLDYGQINWQTLYDANSTGNNADYYVYDDVNEDTTITFNTNITTELSDNIILNGRLNYSKLDSDNYAKMTDLLGAQYHLDLDGFADVNSDAEQYDLNNPNRQIGVNDKFNYNYNITSTNEEAFAQLQFNYDKVDFFVSGQFVNTSHQRDGLFRNGAYKDNSYGKGEKQTFNDASFKGGLTYKITGRHLVNINAGMLSIAPTIRNTFVTSRENNVINPNIASQKINSIDASYIYRAPGVKARLTGYATDFKDGVESAFYYAEGVFLEDENDTSASDFVGEMTTGVDKRNMGVEFGMEVQATPTIKITGVASFGSFKYTNNPNLYLSSELVTDPTTIDFSQEGVNYGLINYGKTNLNGINVGGATQQAYSLGFEYRDPKYWWFGVNGNYIRDRYVSPSRITRTDYFYQDGYYLDNGNLVGGSVSVNPETGNAVTQEDVDNLLTQEKFDPTFLLNAVGGKSWKVGDKYIGFFANISNILGAEYKTGGFEQARKASFLELQQDRALETPIFGNKYWYGNKTTYYLNLYLRF